MGTRALTHIHEGDLSSPIITTIYRQFDGYPDGLGQELADFLAPIKVVNGISDCSLPIANGMGCLAAQVIKHLKDDVGSVYVYHAGGNDYGEQFTYHIYIKGPIGRDGCGIYLSCPEAGIDGMASEFKIPEEEEA